MLAYYSRFIRWQVLKKRPFSITTKRCSDNGTAALASDMLISFTMYSKMNTSIKFAWYLFEFYTNEAYLHFCLNLKIFLPNLKMGLRTVTKSYQCAGSKWLVWKIAKRRDKTGITFSFLSREFIGWRN